MYVVEPENPYVLTDHLRCAVFEKPLEDKEIKYFGPDVKLRLKLLEDKLKLQKMPDAT